MGWLSDHRDLEHEAPRSQQGSLERQGFGLELRADRQEPG